MRHDVLIWQEFLQHLVAHIGSIVRQKKKGHEETLHPCPFLLHAEPTYSCKRLNLYRQRFSGVRAFLEFVYPALFSAQKNKSNEKTKWKKSGIKRTGEHITEQQKRVNVRET